MIDAEPGKTIRVLIADDQEYLREGIRRTLETYPEIDVIATASDGVQALQLALDLLPNVILLDIHMPRLNGVEVAFRVRAAQPKIGLLLLSQYDDPAYIQRFLGSDSTHKGYLLKSTLGLIENLVQAIKAVSVGQLILDPQIAEKLFQSQLAAKHQLTQQEQRILASMAQGLDNQAIAETLTIEKSTVENHINSIYSKLSISQEPGVHRRVQAVLYFLNNGAC